MGIVRDFFFPDLQTTIEEVVDTAVSRASILPPSRETTAVSPVQALKLVPVSRCLSVLENSMIQIPVEVYRGIEQIDTPSWLITPDVENNISQAEFVRDTVVSLAVHGNAFWYITRGNRGITNLEVIPYEDIAVHEDRFGNITYYMGQKKIAPDRIKHLKFWHLPGQYMGEGPLQRHKDTLKAAWDLNNYFANWFDNSAIPTGILILRVDHQGIGGDLCCGGTTQCVNEQGRSQSPPPEVSIHGQATHAHRWHVGVARHPLCQRFRQVCQQDAG